MKFFISLLICTSALIAVAGSRVGGSNSGPTPATTPAPPVTPTPSPGGPTPTPVSRQANQCTLIDVADVAEHDHACASGSWTASKSGSRVNFCCEIQSEN